MVQAAKSTVHVRFSLDRELTSPMTSKFVHELILSDSYFFSAALSPTGFLVYAL
jgi:hypothetical protein